MNYLLGRKLYCDDLDDLGDDEDFVIESFEGALFIPPDDESQCDDKSIECDLPSG